MQRHKKWARPSAGSWKGVRPGLVVFGQPVFWLGSFTRGLSATLLRFERVGKRIANLGSASATIGCTPNHGRVSGFQEQGNVTLCQNNSRRLRSSGSTFRQHSQGLRGWGGRTGWHTRDRRQRKLRVIRFLWVQADHSNLMLLVSDFPVSSCYNETRDIYRRRVNNKYCRCSVLHWLSDWWVEALQQQHRTTEQQWC